MTLLACAALLSGCLLPPTPSDHGWTVHAQRAVGDVASAVATGELVLRHQHDGQLLPNYARVTLAHAEETAGSAADSFAAEQPPASEDTRYAALTDAMDQALGVLADARIAVVRDEKSACPTYCAKLHRIGARLRAMESRL